MNLSKLLGLAFFGVLFVPLLFVRGQPEPPKVTVKKLINECRKDHTSQDIETRRRAVTGFYEFSEQVRTVTTSLRMALLDGDDQIRIKAANALAMIGPTARPATDPLADMLRQDQNSEARLAAARALGSIFRGGFTSEYEKKALDNLVHALRHDPDMRVRKSACYTLGGIGRGAKDAAPELVEVIKESKDEKMREAAADSLGYVAGPDTKSVVPALLAMYKEEKDGPTRVKGTILVVLAKIGDKEEIVVPMLIAVLRDQKNLKMRSVGTIGLGFYGPKSKVAVPALIDALDVSAFKDEGEAFLIQTSCLDTLGKIGPAAKAAIPAVRKIAENEAVNLGIRVVAEKTLHLIDK